MNTAIDRPTVGERYEHAADTSDLTLRPGRCDADLLLAAGYAAQGNVKGTQALTLYRMRATGSVDGLSPLVSAATGWLLDHRTPGERQLRIQDAQHIASTVVHWWLAGACTHCEGRRYELVPGTQIISDDLCRVCDGRGKEPVEHRLRREHQEHGRWLAAEFERLQSYILSDMAQRLRPALDLTKEQP